MVEFIKNFWGLLIGIPAGITTLVAFNEKFIKPRRTKAKLKRLLELMQEWYDFIYLHFDKEIDMDVLDLKEKKITEYLRDNLKHKWIVITETDRKRFLTYCGIHKDLLTNQKLFSRISRTPPDKIPAEAFWQLTCSAFYEFHRNYPNSITPENALPNVEMRIKFLKSYLEVKAK